MSPACSDCGADIKFATCSGDMLRLDAVQQPAGPKRFRLTGGREAEPVSENFDAYAYQLHSETCPAQKGNKVH